MPIERRFDQPSEITTTYSETTITQPMQQKDPNWANYVEGTQSSVFNSDQGLGYVNTSREMGQEGLQQQGGFTSSNIGGSSLGKTDSTFQSSGISHDNTAVGGSFISSDPQIATTSNYDSSSNIPSSNLGLQQEHSSDIPSTNLGSNLDRDYQSGQQQQFPRDDFAGQQQQFGGLSSSVGQTTNNNNNSFGGPNYGGSNLPATGIAGPLDNTFDPSMPSGVDAAADRRAQGFFSGVDTKTQILNEIRDGGMNKKLNHVERDSNSNLQKEQNYSDRDVKNDDSQQQQQQSDNSNIQRDNCNNADLNNNNDVVGRDVRSDVPAQQQLPAVNSSSQQPHREGAYMPETTNKEGEEEPQKLQPQQEKKPFPERVADWLSNKIHPNKSQDDQAARTDELNDVNRRQGEDQSGATTNDRSVDDNIDNLNNGNDVRSDRV